jgi:TonB family protein
MAGNKTEKAASATTPSESLPSKTESGEAASSEIVRRVSPQVLPSARRTIQGTIKVRVRVEVDDAGNVTDAKLESPGPSKYFARISLEAARDWKFAPLVPGALSPREWKLQFAFSRARTSESATRVKR